MDNLDLILEAIAEFEKEWYREHDGSLYADAHPEEYKSEKRRFVEEYVKDKMRVRDEYMEMIEEEQHKSGFYVFQDKMEMWRRER